MADSSISCRTRGVEREPRDWVEEEFEGAMIGDRRLVERLKRIGGAFYEKPTANIPQACASDAGAKGAYRFFDNNKVSMEGIYCRPITRRQRRG